MKCKKRETVFSPLFLRRTPPYLLAFMLPVQVRLVELSSRHLTKHVTKGVCWGHNASNKTGKPNRPPTEVGTRSMVVHNMPKNALIASHFGKKKSAK